MTILKGYHVREIFTKVVWPLHIPLVPLTGNQVTRAKDIKTSNIMLNIIGNTCLKNDCYLRKVSWNVLTDPSGTPIRNFFQLFHLRTLIECCLPGLPSPLTPHPSPLTQNSSSITICPFHCSVLFSACQFLTWYCIVSLLLSSPLEHELHGIKNFVSFAVISLECCLAYSK